MTEIPPKHKNTGLMTFVIAGFNCESEYNHYEHAYMNLNPFSGIFTICGSAAYNLLMISAICVISVPSPDTKRIKEWGVFVWTSAWSVFAYVWILVVLEFHSPKVHDIQ